MLRLPDKRALVTHLLLTLPTCSLIFLVTLFAVWHASASDFVPTPYKLKL